MYKTKIEADLKKALTALGFFPKNLQLIPSENPKFGDYTTNIALQLTKQDTKKTYHSPTDLANAILEKLGHPSYLERVEVAGGGFINLFLKDSALIKILESAFPSKESLIPEKFEPKKYLVEFAHPNTHKAFHIGHLRNISIGESISRILEFKGNEVFRVNYGGDIGPHVAKALWGIKELREEFEAVKSKPIQDKGVFLGKAYALGSKAYESDPKAKEEINLINKKLYAKDPEVVPLWQETKDWSFGYFEMIYARLGTLFDAQIWESDIESLGKQIVMENLESVFIKDDGAIIFPGEKYGLHNRVFITSQGYPTYEGKEVGLTRYEQELFPYDYSIHIVDNQQSSFFEVTTKAIELVESHLAGKKKHLPYGFVNLSTGKMSSRTGNVVTADELILQIKEKLKQSMAKDSQFSEDRLEKIAIAAVKFAYLKYSLNSDITFDIDQSVSIQGDSGVYLLYTYARIHSLLNRAIKNEAEIDTTKAQAKKIAQKSIGIEEEERNLLRQIEFFAPAVSLAIEKFAPNDLCNYLLNLARQFNIFYEKLPVLQGDKKDLRLDLVVKSGEVLKLGLYLLGIETVERM